MKEEIEALTKQITLLLTRLSVNNGADIDISSTDYTKLDGFFLYVGVTGVVAGTDFNGNDFQRTFVTGYHPIKMKKIKKLNTTATNMSALY